MAQLARRHRALRAQRDRNTPGRRTGVPASRCRDCGRGSSCRQGALFGNVVDAVATAGVAHRHPASDIDGYDANRRRGGDRRRATPRRCGHEVPSRQGRRDLAASHRYGDGRKRRRRRMVAIEDRIHPRQRLSGAANPQGGRRRLQPGTPAGSLWQALPMSRKRADVRVTWKTARTAEGSELRPISFVVTCEHGGNRIPAKYAKLFRGRRRLLESHRGYDPGALSMARSLSRALGTVPVASTVSRLLIELNRSPRHPAVYSKVMRKAPQSVRREVYERYYIPY